MNILIYDPPPGIGHFAASVLRGHGHRVALTSDAEEARRRIDTGLFDVLILGPSGAPEDLAAFLEHECPGLPIILAGVPAEQRPAGQLAAILAAPLSAERLISAVRRLEHRRNQRLCRFPVSVQAEGLSLSCRLADLDGNTIVLAGESDEFHRHFGGGPRRVRISVLSLPLDGEAAPTEGGPGQECRLRIRLDPDPARELVTRLRKEPFPSA